MTRRVLTNLVFFLVLGTALMIWAFTSVITIDAVKRPFSVTAEFASSPGLRTDLEVSYLGVRVGSVGDVALRPGHVNVELKLDRDSEVPAQASASVLRKSAVGEPYVELSPPAGGPGKVAMKAGDRIPVARTSVTVEYKAVFDGAGELMRAVRPKDATIVTRELAAGLEGRGTTLRDLIGDLDQFTGTLAADTKTLDSVAVQLTRLTGTLTASGPQLQSGVNDLAAFTSTLRRSREDIDGLLRHGPGMVDQVNGLLTDSRTSMRCMMHALGAPSPEIFTTTNSKEMNRFLQMIAHDLPPFVKAIQHKRPEGSYVRIRPVISVAGPYPDAILHAKERPTPTTPALYQCREGKVGKDAGRPTQPSVDKDAPEGQKRGYAPVPPGPFTTTTSPLTDRQERDGATAPWLPWLALPLAALVIGVTARRALTADRRPRTKK